MATAINNVRVFDGLAAYEDKTVVFEGATVTGINLPIPDGATIIDGTGKTLLPGLIDAHTHTSIEHLRLALTFGVTTELEMAGHPGSPDRAIVAKDNTLADYRSALAALTAPGGHPFEMFKYFPADAFPPPPAADSDVPTSAKGKDTVSSPQEAREFVAAEVGKGADYIKFMIEEGTCCGEPGLPMMSEETLVAGIEEAHRHGKMAMAHALTQDAARQALRAGIDGLAHLFMDSVITESTLELIKENGIFVVATACIAGTIAGHRASIADDARVLSRLPSEWKASIGCVFGSYPQGDFGHILQNVKILHDAGVDVLVGSDAAVPVPAMGGIVHGASVHHELQLFVKAGITPVDALRTATSDTARRFGLDGYGRIAAGSRADLLLVDGNPTVDIEDTLNISGVWRRGERLASK